MIEESLEEAREGIKRVDHLFYVSLKYTRTVDMMRNLIDRIISTFDASFDSLLQFAEQKKKIASAPETPATKAEAVSKLYPNTKKYTDLYLLLRKLTREPYTKREEYRRHVTMISTVGDKIVETDIDIL